MFKIIYITISLILFTGCSWLGLSETEIIIEDETKEVSCCDWFSNSDNEKPFVYVEEKKAIFINNLNVCNICKMKLNKSYKTNHISHDEENRYQYCSMYCFTFHLIKSKKLKNPKVVDVNSLKFIDVKEAFYVVDSDINEVKSYISKFAFSSLEEAKDFQDKNDGDVVNFYKALSISKEDFEEKSWYDFF